MYIMIQYPKGHAKQSLKQQLISKHAKKTQATHPIHHTTATSLYASRGMSFEERINQSNDYYQSINLAVIHKKPTPIQVVKVDYPKRSAARITEAYYRSASTTDYNGVYQGKYLDFEAKETKNRTVFPLSNIREHQILHMNACHESGGICFWLICFSTLQKVFLLPHTHLDQFVKKQTQKSIPVDFFEKHGYECPQGVFPPIDYLKSVDDYVETIKLDSHESL